MSVLISVWFTKGEMSTALAIATTGNQVTNNKTIIASAVFRYLRNLAKCSVSIHL